MKRCTKDKEEKSKSPSVWMKKCSTKLKNKSERSWADLDLDLLGEIKKKLYYGDHVRFGGVCKNWLAAHHEKRAADVLPMLMLLCQRDDDMNEVISYDLYEPLNLDQPVISELIHLNQFFNPSCLRPSISIHYLDGCLFLSMPNIDDTGTHFLIVSIPTHKAITLPQFNHPQGFSIFIRVIKAVSTYPAYSDCVFLALYVADYDDWSIGIFRYGDTQWTTTRFHFPEPVGKPEENVVFIRGVFYFLCDDQHLVSYDIASGELSVDSFSTPITEVVEFFGLGGELMLMYNDDNVHKRFLTSYDWSQKLWVPLKNLGDRSLFLSNHSVYLDAINYNGGSPNKIYVLRHGFCCVFSFENGELVETPSSGLGYWSGLNYPTGLSMWIEPPDLLPK